MIVFFGEVSASAQRLKEPDMLSHRLLHHRMYRFGIMAVALAFVLQTVAVASMPAVSLSAGGEMVVICTSAGMKTVPLAQFLGIESEQNQDQDQEAPGAMPSYLWLVHAVHVGAQHYCHCPVA